MLLTIILGAGILYSAFCFLLGPSFHEHHDDLCLTSSNFYAWLGVESILLFGLVVLSLFRLTSSLFLPALFVRSLFRPPQFS